MTPARQPVPPAPATGAPPGLVSVVIPCRNGGDLLGEQLDSIERQHLDHPEIPFEVVVVDHRSTDHSRDVVRARMATRPYLRLVEAPHAQNISQVRNLGTRAASGDYLLYLDADDMVQEGWLGAMVEAAARYDAVGGALDEDLLNEGPWRRWRMSLMDEHGLTRPFGVMDAPVGCNCGVSRRAWERVGGFDDSWAGAGEEIDFFWRVQMAGMRLGYVPEAVVAYRFRRSVAGVWRQGRHYGEGNARLAAMHPDLGIPPVGAGLTRLCASLVLNGVRAPFSLLRRGQLAFFGAHLLGQVIGSLRYRHLRVG